ncbi:MAG TPA: hypothetical protein VLJ68_11420, partial [Chitinophagaceae bacterium]|nr:hypothetical protein [Chitinophagaceae bacterium]
MRKLLLSTVICSLLLWSCEKHPGKASDGYSPIARDIAKSMIRHYLDSNVVRNDTTIIRNTGIPREYLLWMLK